MNVLCIWGRNKQPLIYFEVSNYHVSNDEANSSVILELTMATSVIIWSIFILMEKNREKL